MLQFVYILFFWILVLEVIIFSFLNLPSPRGWKGAVVKFLNTNKGVRKFLKVHFWLCIIALVFFFDSYSSEQKYKKQKFNIEHTTQGSQVAELNRSKFSYKILMAQRNQYITLMFVFASIALNVYIQILHFMYEKRQSYEDQQKTNPTTTPTGKKEEVF